MAGLNCNRCGAEIDWGFDLEYGRWIPLEPVATHDDLPRTFCDENGTLRADHRDRHKKDGSGVNVSRLEKKVPAEMAQEHGNVLVKALRRRKGA